MAFEGPRNSFMELVGLTVVFLLYHMTSGRKREAQVVRVLPVLPKGVG